MSVTIDSVLVRDKELATADVDGRAVVLSLAAGSYFDFNRVATEIWGMLAEPCRVGEIFDRLSRRHDVDAETLARDVTPFLQTLVEERLVRDACSGRNAMKLKDDPARVSAGSRSSRSFWHGLPCALSLRLASSLGPTARLAASIVSQSMK